MGAARPPAAAAVAAVAVGLAAVYAAISFGLPAVAGGGDVTASSSGIFDMDVQRVVVDLTSAHPGYRTSVHPLQKLLVAPLGIGIERALFGGHGALSAAKLLIAGAIWLQTLLVAWLAARWTGSRWAALATAALCAGSFSSVLAVSLPESAALSSLGIALPLVVLALRWERPFTRGEIAAWAAVGALCIGLTITQAAHWAIALGVRVWRLRAAGAAVARPLAATIAGFAALTLACVQLQSLCFPGTPAFYAASPIAGEAPFMRWEAIGARPFAHALGLLAHVFVFDFAAPRPGYSDFLIRGFGFDYWSLSIEAAGLAQWGALRLALGAVVALAVCAALAGARRADARLLAPALCIASQLVLHFAYGREYVLYSPNWHGVWVALLVALAWRRFPARRGALAVGCGVLAVALLANSVSVMRDVYREVAIGLGTDVRDARGAPLEAQPAAASSAASHGASPARSMRR